MEKLGDKVDFPGTKDYCYLNAASVALILRAAGEAVIDWNQELFERGTVNFDEKAEDLVFKDLHQAAAKLFGAREDDIAVASSVTNLLSSLAWAVHPEKGKNVVSADIDFPSVTYSWMRVAETTGCEVRLAKGERGAVSPDELIKLIDDQTSVVAVSHVEYCSGQCFDLAELADIAHRNGALLFVDASQSAGAVPIDVVSWGVDALVSTSYKWTCAPFGAAVLYLNPELKFHPGVIGWRSCDEVWEFRADHIDYASGARRFEASTMNYGSAVAMARAIEYLLEVGIERIFAHNIALADLLIEGIKELGGEVNPYPGSLRSSIINARFPGRDQNKIASALNAAGVIVSPRMGGVRLSPHLYNTEEDIDKALSVLKKLVTTT